MATSRLGASLQAVLLLLGVATGLYSQDISALKVAAEDGNAQAQAALGNAFHLGVLLPKDDEEAARWWQQAAKQGDVEPEFNLGLAYQLGAGVPRNLTAAAQWYQKAAEQGFASAQQNLGLLYFSGLGVPKDDAEAVRWVRKAVTSTESAWHRTRRSLYVGSKRRQSRARRVRCTTSRMRIPWVRLPRNNSRRSIFQRSHLCRRDLLGRHHLYIECKLAIRDASPAAWLKG
jgi:hypothetical protein